MGRDRARRRVARATASRSRCTRAPACSAPTSPSRCCTGPFGEDGTVQGLLETLDVAYVGSGVAASAVCLDKVLFKELMRRGRRPAGATTAACAASATAPTPRAALAELEALGLPVFVKPAHLGSSVGIVKVRAPRSSRRRSTQAFAHDALVIVEAAANGVEVECGVLGALKAEREQGGEEEFVVGPRARSCSAASGTTTRRSTRAGGMELKIPARISAAAAERASARSRAAAFTETGCEGLARVDFFVEGEHVVLNELNTMPGFTPTSVYARLLEASGVPYEQLVERLCRLALDALAERRAYRY